MPGTPEFVQRHDFPCWCGEKKSRRVCSQMFGRRPFAVVECVSCRTHRILPRALESEPAAAVLYNEYSGGDFSELATDRFLRSMFRRLEQTGVRFGPGQKVLDVGCGNGLLLEAICEKFGCAGRGIDVDRRRIEKARARSHVARFECGLFSADNLQERYDVVISCAVIEHVVDPPGFVQQLKEALADGGSLFLLTPNARSLNYRLLGSWWRDLLSIGEHIYLFTPGSLESCVEKTGLRRVQAASDFDWGFPKMRFGSWRDLLIAAWALYREFVKRTSSLFSRTLSRDILYAHFRKSTSEG